MPQMWRKIDREEWEVREVFRMLELSEVQIYENSKIGDSHDKKGVFQCITYLMELKNVDFMNVLSAGTAFLI